MGKYITGDISEALARAIALRITELKEVQDEASKDAFRSGGEARAHAIESVAKINQELEDLDRSITHLAHRIRLDQGQSQATQFVRDIARMTMEADKVGVPYA
jgi:hypothetical protein